jgi:hypothetical protein
MEINIALVGAVSTGKSTFLNGIRCENSTQTGIRKTTMMPQIYSDSGNDNLSDPKEILETNVQINEKFINLIKNGGAITTEDIKEQIYHVPHIFDFIEKHPEIKINMYDTPGLNDSMTKKVYCDYIKKNFHKFDIFCMIIDITTAFNTSDEVEILELILKGIQNNRKHGINTHLLVLVNKCDDMTLSNGKLILEPELAEMFDQAETIIKNKINEFRLIDNEINWSIMPISAEFIYIYRMYKKNPSIELESKYVNKFGHGEFGKMQWNNFTEEEKKMKTRELIQSNNYDNRLVLAGFDGIVSFFKKNLSLQMQYQFVVNRIQYRMSLIDYEGSKIIDLNVLNEFIKLYNQFLHVDSLFYLFSAKGLTSDSHQKLINNLMDVVNKYINYCNDNIVTPNTINLPTTTDVWEKYMIYDAFYKTIGESFPELYQVHKLFHQKIIEDINHFYLLRLETEPLSYIKLAFLNKLIKNGYEKWQNLLIKCINTEDFLNSEDQLKIYALDDIKKTYNLNHEEHIKLIFNVLKSVYSRELDLVTKYHTSPYSFKREKGITYENKYANIAFFWDNIMIKSTHPHAKNIFILKRKLSAYQLDSSDAVDNNNILLEQYLYKFLKELDPDDICTIDDFFNERQYNSFKRIKY